MKASGLHSSNQRTKRTSLGCLYAFLTPVFAFGLFFLWTGLHKLQEGNTKDGWSVVGFAALFITGAGLFLVFGIRSHRKNETRLKFQEQHPDTPWLWRTEWRDGRIRSKDGKSAILLWIMAVAFVGISLPAVLAIPREWDKGNKPILIALVFPLAGLGLGVAAARATIRTRKFGRSELELHTLPGVLGGSLSGALEIPAKVRSETGFKVRLACIQRTTSGSGKNRSTHERVLWEEEKTILRDFLEVETNRTGLPVFFNVPFNQPQSQDGNPAVVWRLDVRADVPGVDYARNSRSRCSRPRTAVLTRHRHRIPQPPFSPLSMRGHRPRAHASGCPKPPGATPRSSSPQPATRASCWGCWHPWRSGRESSGS